MTPAWPRVPAKDARTGQPPPQRASRLQELAVGTLQRPATCQVTNTVNGATRNHHSAPVPCEVLNTEGQWVSGYELRGFRDDGLLTIHSTRTGAARQLPPGPGKPDEAASAAGPHARLWSAVPMAR